MSRELKRRIRYFLTIGGNVYGSCSSILILFIFSLAYFNPDFAVTITINELGEAHLEMLFVPAFTLISLYSTFIIIRKRDMEEKV